MNYRFFAITRFGRRFALGQRRLSQLSDLTGSRSSTPTENLDTKRARLLYQSTKRGILECDLILGGFCRDHLKELTSSQLHHYDRLVNGGHNEWDIYYWITGAKPTPTEFETDVMQMIRKYALETKKHYDDKMEKP